MVVKANSEEERKDIMENEKGMVVERISAGRHFLWATKLVLSFVVPCLICLAGGVLLACAAAR